MDLVVMSVEGAAMQEYPMPSGGVDGVDEEDGVVVEVKVAVVVAPVVVADGEYICSGALSFHLRC